MFFARETTLVLISFQMIGTTIGQVPPDWFSRIQQDFSNTSFPLRRCFKRMNTTPTNGSRCGPKSKTCFFGDQVCERSNDIFQYPAESCTCNGTGSNDLGTWICKPEVCPVQECQDAVLTEEPWETKYGDSCESFEMFDLCGFYGGTLDATVGLAANDTCCTCGGGLVDSTTQECSDITVPFDPPLPWTDSVNGTCSWYAESPETRCIDFANELNVRFSNMTVADACCACADVTPTTNPTCTDLSGWTDASNTSCNDMLRADCMSNHENFGITVTAACCKCGARATNADAPTEFVRRTKPFKSGCTSDSSKFNMCMSVGPNFAQEDAEVFNTARERWSSIIVGDLSSFLYDFDIVNTSSSRPGSGFFPARSLPQNVTGLPELYESICGYDPEFSVDSVDDTNVCVAQELFPPQIVGRGGVVYGDNFTRFSFLAFNANQIRDMRNTGVVLLGRALFGLGVTFGLNTRFLPNINQTTCDYIGENANRVYQEISGCSISTPLPLENPLVVPSVIAANGTVLRYTSLCEARLKGTCFVKELFSEFRPDLNTTVPPISTVTIAMLDDLGYTVDYSQADPVELNASCVCSNDSETEDPLVRKLQSEENADASDNSPGAPAEVIAYAKDELAKMNEKTMSYMMNSEDDDGNFVGAVVPSMTVMYLNGEAIDIVTVTNEDEDDDEGEDAGMLEGEDADMPEGDFDMEGGGDAESTGDGE